MGSTQVLQNVCIYGDQRTALRCQFSSLPGGSQEWNSGHQVCWQEPSPAAPYYPLCLGLLWAGLSYVVSSVRWFFFFFFLPVVLGTGPSGLPMLDKVLLLSSSYTVQGVCSGSTTWNPDIISESPPYRNARHPFLPCPVFSHASLHPPMLPVLDQKCHDLTHEFLQILLRFLGGSHHFSPSLSPKILDIFLCWS